MLCQNTLWLRSISTQKREKKVIVGNKAKGIYIYDDDYRRIRKFCNDKKAKTKQTECELSENAAFFRPRK